MRKHVSTQHRAGHESQGGHRHDPNDFFGLDTQNMSPKAQVTTSLTVLIPVVLGVVFVLTAVEHMWWLVFTFGWLIFPSAGLLLRGIAGLSDERHPELSSTGARELSGLSRDACNLQRRSDDPVPGTLGPRGQVAVALGVVLPALASFLAAQSPLIFYESYVMLMISCLWLMLLSLGLLIKGGTGLVKGRERRTRPSAADSGERELLEALREHGELTPARAAMETSLTVAEADGMLKRLAEGGHLDVRVRGGGIFYALWRPDGEGVAWGSDG